MSLTAITLAEKPAMQGQLPPLHREAWPPYLRQDALSRRYWRRLYTDFADYQLLLHDDSETVAAVAHTIPAFWNGTVAGLPDGWDVVLTQAMEADWPASPNTLCALAAVVVPAFRGQGVSYRVLQEVKQLAVRKGFGAMIVPIRPTLKSRYPLIPMERYIQWTREDGSPFDPWLRVHLQAGGEILAVAPRSKAVKATVEAWEGWSGMRLPDSGDYIVPGALQPVQINHEQDIGLYVEPNVWIRHPLDTT